MPKVVSNSSPLIALANINSLDILQKMYSEIYIPDMVLTEINAFHDQTSYQINNTSWIHVIKIKNILKRTNFSSDLHQGEIDAMILYDEINADTIILDDLDARDWAKEKLHCNVTGTIGVLMKAKCKGFVTDLRSLFLSLKQNNFFLNTDFANKILSLFNELPL